MSIIFDFETLSTDRVNGVVLSLALLEFKEERFTEKTAYSYTELLEMSRYIKFDVADQVKNGKRKIDQDTLEWWGQQSETAQKQLIPSQHDKPLADLIPWLSSNINGSVSNVYSRGNTFDPIFVDYIASQYHQVVPWPHWSIRDTRSMIDGMAWGSNLSNGFVPEGLGEQFVAHDPQHDIVMDVMRLQTLAIALG